MSEPAVDTQPGPVASDPSRRGASILAVVCAGVVLVFCASPGLTGTWVYDDLRMLENPSYDSLGDALRVWGQTSGDYLENAGAPDARGAETYRPLTMMTLVATHAISPTPLAHHLVGLVLHFVTALLLYGLLLTLTQGGLGARCAALGAVLFLLHPAAVEAYVWINGRSDLVAGVMCAGTLLWTRGQRRTRLGSGSRALVAFLLAFGACSAKETASLAVIGGWLVFVLGEPPGRQRWLEPGAALLGAMAYGATWFTLGMGEVEHFGHAEPLWADQGIRVFALKQLFLYAGAMGSFRAAPMQSLAWLSQRPLTPSEWFFGSAFLLGLLVAVIRRRYVPAVFLLVAIGSWLPTVVISRALWFGMDRYLYMPLILTLSACVGPVAEALTEARASMRKLAFGAWALVALTAASGTFVASGFYQDHQTWVFSAIENTPEDPTRYVVSASEFQMNGQPEAGRVALGAIPPPPYPRAVWEQLLKVALQLDMRVEYTEWTLAAVSTFPDDPAIALHGVNAALLAGDATTAIARSGPVANSPFCGELLSTLSRWARSAPPDAARDAVLRTARELPCRDRTVEQAAPRVSPTSGATSAGR